MWIQAAIPALLTVSVIVSAAMAGPEDRLYLDFDHDNDLYTIQGISHEKMDTVSIILEVWSGPTSDDRLYLGTDLDCCRSLLGDLLRGVAFCWEEDWCNEHLLEFCEWGGPLEPTPGWDCPNPILSAQLRSGTPFVEGQRYLLGKFCLIRDIPLECYPPPFAYLRMQASGAFRTPYSNYVFIGHDAPSSVPDEGPPQEREVTWGVLKAHYRDPLGQRMSEQ